FILNWLAYAEETLGYNGLNKTNKLEPTAELRPLNQNQTDERDLMPYHILNEIESCAIGKWLSPKETFLTLKNTFEIPQGKLKDFIAKFYRLWSLNQWKRERFAPS